METLKMETEETLAHSRAFIFVLDHYVQLLKNGFGEPEFYFGNSSRVTYLYDPSTSDIISACVWSIDPTRRAGTIHFSATEQSRRKQGHYKKIFTEVQRMMINKGAVTLYSSVHLDNEPMIAAAESSGRKKSFYRTKKSLRKS